MARSSTPGPFPDGDRIHDLPHAVSTHTRMPRAAYTPLGPKMLHQLFFQNSARLDEQTAVNGFVGHAHTLVVGILDLSAIPKSVPATSPGSVYPQRSSAASPAWPGGTPWAARPTPRLGDPLHSLDTVAPTMRATSRLTWTRPLQPLGDLTNGRTAAILGDVLSLRPCEGS